MFMTWRTPRHVAPGARDEISNEQLDRAIREQFQSTYGKSYVAMPQGFDLSSAYVDSGAVLPVFTKNTEIRENYDAERSIHGIEQPIKENTSRYGANKTKHMSVKGSVPRVVPRDPLAHQTQVTVKSKPMYQTDYCGVPETTTLAI